MRDVAVELVEHLVLQLNPAEAAEDREALVQRTAEVDLGAVEHREIPAVEVGAAGTSEAGADEGARRDELIRVGGVDAEVAGFEDGSAGEAAGEADVDACVIVEREIARAGERRAAGVRGRTAPASGRSRLRYTAPTEAYHFGPQPQRSPQLTSSVQSTEASQARSLSLAASVGSSVLASWIASATSGFVS